MRSTIGRLAHPTSDFKLGYELTAVASTLHPPLNSPALRWAGQEYRIVGHVVGPLPRTIFDLTCDSSVFPLAPFHVNSPFNYHTNKVLEVAYAAIDVKYRLVTRRDHRWQ